MGIVVGLYDYKSFENVGSNFAVAEDRLELKKWAGSSKKYKLAFVDHLAKMHSSGHVMCGVNVTAAHQILLVGGSYFQRFIGPFPQPSSFNRNGRPRVTMGGYSVDGETVPTYEVLVDDLCVLGWIAESISSLLFEVDQINGEPCKFDVLYDRLPNEQGGERYYKATLLKDLLGKITDGRANLVGVPDPSIEVQRDLFVDNVAGLARELRANPISRVSNAYGSLKTSPIRITRFNT